MSSHVAHCGTRLHQHVGFTWESFHSSRDPVFLLLCVCVCVCFASSSLGVMILPLVGSGPLSSLAEFFVFRVVHFRL